MNYSTIKTFDIANGIGCRTSLFVSGCRNHCPECFNPETWNFAHGKLFEQDAINYILDTLAPSYIEGLSILGGEPFEPDNQKDILVLLERVKAIYPNKGVWVWTGFYWDDLFSNTCRANTPITKDILEKIDVLVDGPFDKDQKALGLRFRGSANQRLIDVPSSLSTGAVVLWEDDPLFDNHNWATDQNK